MVDAMTNVLRWRGPVWRGEETSSIGDTGERTLLRVIGGYIVDREIRTAPGWKQIAAPALNQSPGQDGYLALVVDSKRPVAAPSTSTDLLRDRLPIGAIPVNPFHVQHVWADPTHLWSFHVVRGRTVVIGETGLRVEPIMNDAHTIVARVNRWDISAGKAVLELDMDPGVMTGLVANEVKAGDVVYVDRLVDANSADAARLNRRVHFIESIARIGAGPFITRIFLSTTISAASVGNAMTGRVGRVRGNRAGKASFSPDGRALYGESEVNALLDPEAITAWFIEDPFDVDGMPVEKAYASYVANRQRDYGDTSPDSATPALNPGLDRMTEGHKPQSFSSSPPVATDANWGIPRRLTKRAPYRGVSRVCGDRILMAVPGYGCLFQVPAIIPGTSSLANLPLRGAIDGYNDTACRPRSLGVPKGMLCVPNAANGAPLVTVLPNLTGFAPGTGGTFSLAIAYRDDATGEIGQLSEVWTFTQACAAGESLSISFIPAHPGYVLNETMALSVMIFFSKVNETALNHVATIQLRDNAVTYAGAVYIEGTSSSSVYGLDVTTGYEPAGVGSGQAVRLFELLPMNPALVANPALYNTQVELPIQRTMPRGGTWIGTVRGVPISGGNIGDRGDAAELLSGLASSLYQNGSNNNNPREVTLRWIDEGAGYTDAFDLVANRTIPSGYGGLGLWGRTLFPFPVEFVTLERLMNFHCANPMTDVAHTTGAIAEERYWLRWLIKENPHRWDATRNRFTQPAYLVLPRGQIQVHEPGLPSVSLGQGKQPVDANKDEETVAGGEYVGTALFFTQRHTYHMAWSVGPAGSVPLLASNNDGNITPNAVVEHGTGTSWISERGICTYAGRVDWRGQAIARWFRGADNRFLRDSRGMMRQAFGAYDENRGQVLFGLTENRSQALLIERDGAMVGWANTDDRGRSRFPCDTILAWNPAINAVAEWQLPDNIAPFWMTPVPCVDGVQRMAFLAADRNVYALDDNFGQENLEPVQCDESGGAAVTNGSVFTTTNSLATGTQVTDQQAGRAGVGSFAKIGMDVLIYDPATFTLKHRSTIQSIAVDSPAPGSTQITLVASGSWANGDRALIGGRTLIVEGSFLAPRAGETACVAAVGIRLRVSSRITRGLGPGILQPLWCKATVMRDTHPSGRHGGSTDRKKEHTFHRNSFGDFVANSTATEMNRQVRLEAGSAEGAEMRCRIELFGGAQAGLQDFWLEVPSA